MVKVILRLAGEPAPLRFVDDQRGCPTFADDLAGMLVQLAVSRAPGVFHVTNQGATSWYGFRSGRVVAAAGHDPGRVLPIKTADLDPPGPRRGQPIRCSTTQRCGCSGSRCWLTTTTRWTHGQVPSCHVNEGSSGCSRQLQRQGPPVACVASLFREGLGSSGGAGQRLGRWLAAGLSERYPAAKWVALGPTLVTDGAANIGAAMVDRGYLLICNADVVVDRGCSGGDSRASSEVSPQVAVVGPRILGVGGELYPSARRFPDLLRGASGTGWWASSGRATRFPAATGWRTGTTPAPGRSTGSRAACFLARRQAWDRWAASTAPISCTWRTSTSAGASGGRVVVAYEPAAQVTHVQGVSADRHPYRMLLAHHVSMWRFAARTTSGHAPLVVPLGAGRAWWCGWARRWPAEGWRPSCGP